MSRYGSADTAYVLVHGALHGAWCWERLEPHLQAPSLAVDLPGRGTKPADRRGLTIADFAASVVSDIDNAGYDNVVLVGHSIAGVTIPAVADLLGARVQRMVYVSCVVPREGDSIVDTISPVLRWFCLRAIQRGCSDVALPRQLARYLLCNDMDAETANSVLSRMCPDAMGVTAEAVPMRSSIHTVPRSFIKLSADRVLRPQLQDRMIANLRSPDVRTLDAGHDAMLSRPRELASMIEDLVQP